MSEPLNVKISSVDKIIKEEHIQEVKSNFIKSSSMNTFHPEGLFSEEIFGEIASERRLVTFGYIKLNTKVFHPVIYKNLLQLKRFYGEILSGRSYSKFDEELEDFVQASIDDEDAGTGFLFFLKHFDKIKFTSSDSLDRQDKIEIFTKYKDDIFVDKWFVIPAGIRDIKIEEAGQTKEDINKLYSSLLNYSRVIPDQGKNNPLYDNVRYSIQRKILEIKEYLDNINSGKTGFFQKKYGARNLALGTRNVSSSANFAATSIDSAQFLDIDESFMGVFQTVKCFQPAIIYQLKTLFFDAIFDNSSNQIGVIDTEKYNLRYVPIGETEKDKFLSSKGLSDIINLCKSPEFRKLPITVTGEDKKNYYLFMVYDTGDSIYYYRSYSDFIGFYENTGNKFDVKYTRPLTYLELLYVCAWMVSADKHVLVTRYPVLGTESIYPSKIHLSTTLPARQVNLKIVFDDNDGVLLPEYPILGNKIFDSFSVHSSKMAGLGSDNDGDMFNVTGVIAKESNDEIREHLNSVAALVRPDGSLVLGGSTDLIEMTFMNLSRMDLTSENNINDKKIVNDSLVNELLKVVKPYYDTNDGGHKIEHAQQVVDEGKAIALWSGHSEILNEVICAGYLHDIHSDDREMHQELAAESLSSGKLSKWFNDLCNKYDLNSKQIINAVREHRASYRGKLSSIVSEIISSADRGRPDIVDKLIRSTSYHRSKNPDATNEQIIKLACDFLQEKYSRNSEATFPDIWKKYYASELEKFYKVLEDRKTLEALALKQIELI